MLIRTFQKGLAAQATINGYKYWPDAALDP
nr:hypothetical protein [Klebsiella pneumoniae]